MRIVERSMEFREASRGAGPVERALLWLGGDSPERDADDFPEMYREILRVPRGGAVAEWDRPTLQAHLIVLLGELGETNLCRTELEGYERQWKDSRFVAAARRVYLFEPETWPVSLSSAAQSLSDGWTGDRFSARLAEAEGRLADARRIESKILARGQSWRRRVMASLAVDLALVVAALAILARAWWRGGNDWRRRPDNSLAPWPASDGMGVVFATFAARPTLTLLLLVFPNWVNDWVGWYLHSLLTAVPAVVFVSLCLLRPHALGFRRHFGIEFPRRALNVLVGGAIVIVGLHIAGWQIAARVGGAFGLKSHWSEGLDENLLYDLWAVKLTVLVNMALFAPVGEELLFRGVLFGTLRKRMGFLAAASISSAAFALIHHYSVLGLMGVFCLGFGCALVYERTRNLGACIAGHMLTNLLIGLYDIALLG